LAGAAAGVAAAALRRHQFSFTDKAVLITGASRGLGLVMARRLAQQGAMLGLLARNAAELTRARQTIDAATLVQLLPADVTDPAQVQLGQWANGPMGQWADGPIGQSANRQAP